ncbi:MAG: FAD-dependent oxidoreductase, partial [Pseudomonadota bacterium]
MFVDARSLSDGQRIEADVCIIGGGAAGITIARELIGTGIRVALLEGGDIGWDEQAQDLYAGESVGFPGWSLDEARLRYFGGSTNHWAGNCVPLDPIDFESRPGVPHSGWPIGRETLDPYYLRALPIVGCRSERPFDVEQLTAEAGLPVLPLDPASGLRNIVVNQSPPTQFGFAYEDELAAAENVVVYLNAHVLEIELDDLASRVTGVRIGTFDGPALTATARHYILCAGGIENARLMLASTGVAPAGVGNDNDLVGRFFMDHIGVRPGLRVLMSDNAPDLGLYATQHELADGRAYAAIFGTDEVLREEGIGGFWISMFPHEGISPGHGSGRALRKGLTSGELPDQLGWHVGNVLTDLDGLLNGAYRFATGGEEDLVARQWMDLWVTVESIPLPDSRVMLGEARDPFGM